MPSATTAGHWCELETTEMHRGPVKQVWLVSTPMHLGYFSMNTPDDESAGTLGPALEERGFESLWFGEHAHIPCSSVGLYPAEGGMPAPYRRMLDPFVSLAVAATATSALKLGTAVALPLEHDLFALAKCVSSLDRLSHGRLLLGVGVGWNEHEIGELSLISLVTAISGIARVHPGPEGSLDRRGGRLPWRVLRFRSGVVRSQAVPVTAPPDPVWHGREARDQTRHRMG